MAFSGRIGIAFHRTLETLVLSPPASDDPQVIAEEARHRFLRELKAQEAKAQDSPRERFLPRDPERARMAAEAVISEATRLLADGATSRNAAPVTASRASEESMALSEAEFTSSFFTTLKGMLTSGKAEPTTETEVEVASKDGLLHGRIDRVERNECGVLLVDFKSAMRDDLPERYVRQLQLYAYLWHERRGEWPYAAQVIYPLTAATYSVVIEPEECLQKAAEAKSMLRTALEARDPFALAVPGDTCHICDFRPWCQAFWNWQRQEQSPGVALERSRLGFQGRVEKISLTDHVWRVQVRWRQTSVEFVAPEERFPQMKNVKAGSEIRCLDFHMHGLRHAPKAKIDGSSELFIVKE